METKDDITLIAPCGIHCGACPMYKVKDDPSLREGLVKRINWNGVPCPGCRSAKGKHQLIQGTCATYACVSSRGHDFCYECKDFPCEHFAWILERYPQKLEEQKNFKKLGFEKWLRFHAERAEKGYANATKKYYTRAKRD